MQHLAGHPCGTIFDYLRVGYRVKMRTYATLDPIDVAWFEAPEGANHYSTGSTMRSRNWLDATEKPNVGLGEQRPADGCFFPEKVKVGPNVAYLGNAPCVGLGDAHVRRVFLTGGVVGVDPPLVLDQFGAPACCDTADGMMVLQLQLGGEWDMVGDCLLFYGACIDVSQAVELGGDWQFLDGAAVEMDMEMELGGEWDIVGWPDLYTLVCPGSIALRSDNPFGVDQTLWTQTGWQAKGTFRLESPINTGTAGQWRLRQRHSPPLPTYYTWLLDGWDGFGESPPFVYEGDPEDPDIPCTDPTVTAGPSFSDV